MIDYVLYKKDANIDQINNALIRFDNYFKPKLSDRTSLTILAEKLCNKANIIVAIHDESIIGIAAYYFNIMPQSSYLSVIAVEEKYRDKKIGQRLVNLMISDCRINGSAGIKLEMRAENINLLNFYNKLGFIKTDEFYSEYNNELKYYLYLKL